MTKIKEKKINLPAKYGDDLFEIAKNIMSDVQDFHDNKNTMDDFHDSLVIICTPVLGVFASYLDTFDNYNKYEMVGHIVTNSLYALMNFEEAKKNIEKKEKKND